MAMLPTDERKTYQCRSISLSFPDILSSSFRRSSQSREGSVAVLFHALVAWIFSISPHTNREIGFCSSRIGRSSAIDGCAIRNSIWCTVLIDFCGVRVPLKSNKRSIPLDDLTPNLRSRRRRRLSCRQLFKVFNPFRLRMPSSPPVGELEPDLCMKYETLSFAPAGHRRS